VSHALDGSHFVPEAPQDDEPLNNRSFETEFSANIASTDPELFNIDKPALREALEHALSVV
jgi:hypothetical protein